MFDSLHHLQVGQRVCDLSQLGSNSEYLCLPASGVIPVPNSVDADRAVCLVLCYMTAYQMLYHFAEVKPGNRVLIHGAAGAVGTALLQLGRDLGLEMVGVATRNHRSSNPQSSQKRTQINCNYPVAQTRINCN